MAMRDYIVCSGVPFSIEERTFKKADGSEGSSVRFRLRHPLLGASFPARIETQGDDVREQIIKYADSDAVCEVLVEATAVRYERDGEPSDFCRFRARAVIGVTPPLSVATR